MPKPAVHQDLDDCRALADRLLDEGIGTQTSVVYMPLKPNDPNPYSQHFLRMGASMGAEHESGSIEIVEQYCRNPSERIRMGYAVAGSALDAFFDEDPFISSTPIDWPMVLQAPSIMGCIEKFQDPAADIDIDAEALLAELAVVREPGRTTPHIQVRSAKDLDVEGYTVGFKQRTHAMPGQLAQVIQATYAVGETLAVTAEYQGRMVLDVVLQFDSRENLVAVGGNRRGNVDEHIAALAGFKRAIFD